MLTVGLLMIAMLVGLGASAAGSFAKGYDWSVETKAVGQFLEADDETDEDSDEEGQHIHTEWENEYNVVGSRGGAYTCCGCCPPDGQKSVPV